MDSTGLYRRNGRRASFRPRPMLVSGPGRPPLAKSATYCRSPTARSFPSATLSTSLMSFTLGTERMRFSTRFSGAGRADAVEEEAGEEDADSDPDASASALSSEDASFDGPIARGKARPERAREKVDSDSSRAPPRGGVAASDPRPFVRCRSRGDIARSKSKPAATIRRLGVVRKKWRETLPPALASWSSPPPSPPPALKAPRTRLAPSDRPAPMSGTLPPCVSDPLGTVSALFDAASRSADPRALEDGDWGVRATFERALGEPGVLARVPEINAVGVDAIPPGALVRFRCMVQDMYNPEYYVGAYREEGANGPAWRTTKYTEDPGPGPSPGAEVAGQSGGPHDPSSVKIWERRVLYCVPVPGESEWVRVADGAGAGAPPRTPAKRARGRRQRRRGRLGGGDDAADAPDSPTPMDDEAPSSPPTTTETTGATDAAPIAPSSGGRPVRVRGDDAGAPDELNLPLGPAETAAPDVPRCAGSLPAPTPCIVKLYDDFERRPGTTGEGSSGDDSGGDFDVKLNDVLELVGVLAIAPELAGEREELEAAAAEAAALRGAGDANRRGRAASARARRSASTSWTRRGRTTRPRASSRGSTRSRRDARRVRTRSRSCPTASAPISRGA